MIEYLGFAVNLATVAVAYKAFLKSKESMDFTRKTYQEGIDHNRKKDTLEAFNTLQCQALDKLNEYSNAKIREIAEYKGNQDEEFLIQYREISGYIARIEHFCVGVVNKVYDTEIVYQLAHNYFDKGLRHRIQPMLDKKNANGQKNYEYTEKVFEMLKNFEKEYKL